MTVLFKPRASMMQQCARFLIDADKGIFEIPMKVWKAYRGSPIGGKASTIHSSLCC